MNLSSHVRENWLRPFFFYGNNPLSLIGGALTTASALVLVGFWVIGFFGHGAPSNPYVGIIIDLCLPGLFILGLLLIPAGIGLRRQRLKASGEVPTVFPQINFSDPVFRRGINVVAVATFINFVIVGTASYRGVAYMDTPNFCGQTCHVMSPEATAYPVSSHAGVECTSCHIATGIGGFVTAKLNGSKQLMHVVLNNYPRPIMAEDKLPPASRTCLNCHNPNADIGDKLLIKTAFADDEKNSVTKSIILVHVGGRDQFGQLSGIHGAHLGHIEYIPTDTTNQTIPWVAKTDADGSVTEYLADGAKAPVSGQKRLMDCIDCHNRAAHSFDTAENALNKDMTHGMPSPALPFMHKEGLILLKAKYGSEAEAMTKIPAGLEDFYKTQYPAVWGTQRASIEQAERMLVTIYTRNVFPFMNVTWGTHPNNIGHTDYLGCFRCHDGSHNAKGGKTITNDCATCHNLVAVDDPAPKQLAALGLQ